MLKHLRSAASAVFETASYLKAAATGGALLVMFFLRAVTNLSVGWIVVGGVGMLLVMAAFAMFVAERGDELGWREKPTLLGIGVLDMEPIEPLAIPTIGVGEPLAPVLEVVIADRRHLARQLFEQAEQEVHYVLAHSSDNYDSLRAQVATWQQKVRGMIESNELCSECDRSSFRVITPFTPRGWRGRTQLHAHLLEEVFERIERLRSIARRVEGV